MAEPAMGTGTLSKSQTNMEAYIRTHDVKYIAEDAVYTNLATGEETRGREAVGEMLNYIYHVAFDAKAEVNNSIITADKELLFGRHCNRNTGKS